MSEPVAPTPAPRLGWRATLGLLAALLAAGSLHFLRPNTTAHRYSVKLCGPVSYYFNADSAAFARLVIKFPEGFGDCEQGRIRQLRPLYPALGRAIYAATKPCAALLPKTLVARAEAVMGRANHPEIWQGVTGREVASAWTALVVVNVLCGWLALALIFGALSACFDRRLAFLLALAPALHFNAIDFLFVPSSECFNLLIPAVFVWCAARVWSAGRSGTLAALGLGLLMLGKEMAYPFANWLYEHLRARPEGRSWRKALLVTALFAAPVGIYLLALAVLGVRPHSGTAQDYRQVVWMLDYAREGRLLEIPLRWGQGLGLHLWHSAVGFGPPLVVTLALALRRDRCEFRLPRELRAHLIFGALACAIFWALVGYYDVRLAVTQYPAVIFALGALAVRKSACPERWVAAALALSALAYLAGLFRY